VTSLFVTHDQEEAFEVADRVVVMNAGRIEQVGTPGEVFEQPANAFVMDFLGNVNMFRGRVEEGKAVVPGLELAYPDYPHAEARDASVFVRPHEMVIDREKSSDATRLEATILHVNPTGSMIKIELRAVDFDALINAEIPAERFRELDLKPGDHVHLSPRRVRVFTEPPPAIEPAPSENGNGANSPPPAAAG
jgi:sulfate transport system ATP-binding protein